MYLKILQKGSRGVSLAAYIACTASHSNSGICCIEYRGISVVAQLEQQHRFSRKFHDGSKHHESALNALWRWIEALSACDFFFFRWVIAHLPLNLVSSMKQRGFKQTKQKQKKRWSFWYIACYLLPSLFSGLVCG